MFRRCCLAGNRYSDYRKCWSKAALGLCMCAVVIGIISCILPFWMCGSDFCFGLFLYCVETRNKSRCFNLGPAGDCEETARTQIFLGLILGLGGVVVQMEVILVKNSKTCFRLLAFLLPFFAFSFTVYGATVFVNTSMETDPFSRVCSSFYMTIFAGLLFLVSGTGQILDTIS